MLVFFSVLKIYAGQEKAALNIYKQRCKADEKRNILKELILLQCYGLKTLFYGFSFFVDVGFFFNLQYIVGMPVCAV